jgi:mannosylglycerate hydrolase
MRFEGEMEVPSSLDSRKSKLADVKLKYSLTVSLRADSKVLRVAGEVVNAAENHRLRIGLRTGKQNEFSYAGAQYSVIKRPCLPEEIAIWKDRGYFEEPSATRPLLNHVSAVDEKGVITVFTRSLKEYEFIKDGYSDLMLTVLRAVGYVGLPDLHRRPGRPSGMPERLLPAPTHQLMGSRVEFDFGVGFSHVFDTNLLFREYAEFAVDPLYGQNQTIDPTFYPISYFPINTWPEPLPRQFHFASLQDTGVSFGTFIKSEVSADYVLRLFNADNSPANPGRLALGEDLNVVGTTDLLEETSIEHERLAAEFKAGELLNLVINQNRKDA